MAPRFIRAAGYWNKKQKKKKKGAVDVRRKGDKIQDCRTFATVLTLYLFGQTILNLPLLFLHLTQKMM